MLNYILYILGFKTYQQPNVLCVNSFHHTDRTLTSIEKFAHDDDEENYNYDFNLYRFLKRCYINQKIYNFRNVDPN